jgi:hypothetical protein
MQQPCCTLGTWYESRIASQLICNEFFVSGMPENATDDIASTRDANGAWISKLKTL